MNELKKTIIIEQVSTNGTWSSNLPLDTYRKSFIEYMKLCDVIPVKLLSDKFIIIPSYQSENCLICLYFNPSNDNTDNSKKFASVLMEYMKNPKKFHEKLIEEKTQKESSDSSARKTLFAGKSDESISSSIEEEAIDDNDDFACENLAPRTNVYDETGYEVTSKSPRKLSIPAIMKKDNPKYITRGSFSNVSSDFNFTDIDCRLRLVYLMNEEYFSNFNELENLHNLNFTVFNNTNEHLSNNKNWKDQIVNAFRDLNKSVDVL